MVLLFIWCCMGRVVLECTAASIQGLALLQCADLAANSKTPALFTDRATRRKVQAQVQQAVGLQPCSLASTHFASLEPLPRPISPILPHPTPPPTTTPCPILPFLPPNHPTLKCLHLPYALVTFLFQNPLPPKQRGGLFPSSRESGLTTLLLVFVHDPGFFLVPCCPTGSLTLVRTGVLWPANTGGGAHGTQRCCSTAAHM